MHGVIPSTATLIKLTEAGWMNRTDHQQYTISEEQSKIPPCTAFQWFEKCPECGNTRDRASQERLVTVAGTGGVRDDGVSF